MATLISLSFLCLRVVCAPTLSLSRPNRVPHSPAGIYRLVENRGGRVSCWGVVIRLSDSRFRGVIRPDQIVIREAKHGHDLRGVMSWRVGRGEKQLVIKFKPGMGDFGSGNRVEVLIERSALSGRVESQKGRLEWSIDTDVP
jgi:hypothetical protein